MLCPRPQSGELEQGLPGREPGRRQRRGVGQLHRPRRGGQHLGRREHVFGGGVGVHRQERHHRVAHLPSLDAFAELGHRAGDIEAGHVREAEREHLLQRTGANSDVDRVERGARDLDQHLARAGGRPLGLLVLQHITAAVPVVSHCLHDFVLR